LDPIEPQVPETDQQPIREMDLPPPIIPPSTEPVHAGGMIEALLKSPGTISGTIAQDRSSVRTGVIFLASAVLFHAIFGFAVGLFSGWAAGAVAFLKAGVISIASLLLCFPSLYVFSAVGGAPLSARQTFVLGSSCLALIGVLLIGLAPVAWLFAVSTESVGFVTTLIFVIWLTAVIFADRFTGTLRSRQGFERSGGILLWFIVFILVSMQMTTYLRPILQKPDFTRGVIRTEKKFFLQHFFELFETKK
jgi:hypothetical protein